MMAAEERPWIRASEGGVEILVHVQPGARRSGVVGFHGDAVKVAVTAPPADGKANKAVIEAVASLLGVKRGAVRIVAGQTARRKRLVVSGLDPEEAARKLGLLG